ncbi:unnamed protein product [Blepharisma stoltei]|uniref:Trafficking protein particle complex subunit 6B n=1 Tax=Blepharisma stoltei TaxID=1481888 RepID=A0AAU9JTM3_9CILI|nr:unnamed protein product [Blepharisma stoltei]
MTTAQGIPDFAFHLLINEVIKQTIIKTSQQSLIDALKELTREQILEKKKELKKLGLLIGERVIGYIVKEHIWLKEPNAVLRFVCKEFWLCLFGKYIDRLQSNNRGVYIMYDYKFRWLQSLSLDTTDSVDKEAIEKFYNFMLSWVCGVIKGGLKGLGVSARSEAKVEEEGCKFTVTLKNMIF